jgi:cell division protein FtsZ
VVSVPFSYEGPVRKRNAYQGLEVLQSNVDTLIVIQNQRLMEIGREQGGLPLNEAFRQANEVLYKGVSTITDLIVKPGLVNLDFGDVRTVLLTSKKDGKVGRALMGMYFHFSIASLHSSRFSLRNF